MTQQPLQVLFLCTGNSARSVLAESLLNHLGRGEFVAHSAGSHPKGEVHPAAIALLEELHLPTRGLRSKSWDEFAQPDAPRLDFVFTVCDNAAGEVCPVWFGAPVRAHWGVADPAAVTEPGAAQQQAFRTALHELETRIRQFLSLPVRSMDKATLERQLRAIGTQAAQQAQQ